MVEKESRRRKGKDDGLGGLVELMLPLEELRSKEEHLLLPNLNKFTKDSDRCHL